MGTTTEELKKLYAKLGGTDPNIPKASTPGEVLNGINELELGGDKLPEVTEADNGKALGVKQGQWDKMDVDIELPDVTTDDNGKVLMVSEGNWGKSDLPSGDEVVRYIIRYNPQYTKLLLPGDIKISDVINDFNNKKVILLKDQNDNVYTICKCTSSSIAFTNVTRTNSTSNVNKVDVRLLESDGVSTNSFTIKVHTYIEIPQPNAIYDHDKILAVNDTGRYALKHPKTWSTTEHIVGKWIDGTTDVYERSYHVEGLTGAPSDWESMFEVNVADIVHTEGSAHKSNGEIISIENTGFRVCANPQIHPGYMCYHFTDADVTEFTVTVQYTKAS